MFEVRIPRENANDDSVLISKVTKTSGDYIQKGDLLIEFETSKALIELTAPESGYVTGLVALEGMILDVDKTICYISKNEPVLVNSGKNVGASNDSDQKVVADDVKVSSAARKLIQQGEPLLIESKWLTSKAFQQNKNNHSIQHQFVSDAESVEDNVVNVDKKLKNVSRRKILEVEALRKNSSYLNSTIGISIITGKRLVKNEMFADGILDLLCYEISNLLKTSFSDLNAYYVNTDSIGLFENVVPGIALDSRNNLSVVSIDAFTTLKDLQSKLISVIARFSEGKLLGADYRETTYTISDLSASDADFMLPLINGYQTFIIGVVRNSGGFKLFGTFDHRVTEGKRFSEFLSEIKARIELYFDQIESPNKEPRYCYYCEKTLAEELGFGNRGLIKIDDGVSERLICRVCFEGW